MRILLVEDQTGLLQALGEALTEAGHELAATTTFRLAEDLLAATILAWDALIADVRLPGGNGAELAAKAQQMRLPALLITGHPDAIVSLQEQGLTYLRKPFSLTELTGWLNNIAPSKHRNCSAPHEAEN